jgi:hypothetical protein
MLMHLVIIAGHKLYLDEVVAIVISTYTTASTEKMKLGCTCSNLRGVSDVIALDGDDIPFHYSFWPKICCCTDPDTADSRSR